MCGASSGLLTRTVASLATPTVADDLIIPKSPWSMDICIKNRYRRLDNLYELQRKACRMACLTWSLMPRDYMESSHDLMSR